MMTLRAKSDGYVGVQQNTKRNFMWGITLPPLPIGRNVRPGMTANIGVPTETLKNVLWAPAPALFESDGRTFVYVHNAEGFLPQDVKLVRRSESQVIIEGLAEGRMVALASPDQMSSKKKA